MINPTNHSEDYQHGIDIGLKTPAHLLDITLQRRSFDVATLTDTIASQEGAGVESHVLDTYRRKLAQKRGIVDAINQRLTA
ncbi:hypothetical protein [Desertimonas flava]|uniref:hypothetical protein n=1 Tax=Desertimonas flava TaxID=2064846 RepID=UPI000E356085|nr:hypothetical protein [Desertimonas flava]